MKNNKNYILDELTAAKKLRRMAYEIIENNTGELLLVLAGIRESGTIMAKNIQQLLAQISDIPTDLITISLDKHRPEKILLNKEGNFDDKVVIVIDDVAMSGKTLLYAMQPFLAFHPKKIQILVLVERSHKAFPVKPDYVGLSIATTLQEHIYVEAAGDTIKGAYLE
ncbi:MAG: bifunctional pyr operon transcriptional regulator/uracil phosphoribosyltransferase PyrR [Chitinophagaceae bacterium]